MADERPKVCKPKCRFGRGGAYIAVFSNVGSLDPNAVYLLATRHCRGGDLFVNVTIKQCKDMLKRYNKRNDTAFRYIENIPY